MGKRHYLAVLAACLLVISIISCSKDNNVVKDRTNLLFDLIASRETDSILTLYPDFDDSYMVIESDSIKITKVEENKEGGYDVVLTNFYSKDHMPSLMTTKQIVLSFTKSKDGEYYIKKSCGLLNTERMPYQAAATGYIQERSKDADVEVIKGMSILDSVVIFAKQERYERVKKQIKVEIVYNSVKDFYRISNYSDEYIQKLSFNGEFTYDHKNTSGIVFHNKCTVQDLPSNHNITVPFPLIDGDFFAILYRNANFSYRETGLFHLKSYDITNITFEFEIDYKGDEYANYLKKHPKAKVSNEDKSKEEEYLSLLEDYVMIVERLHSIEEIKQMPIVNKKYSLKAEYLFGVKGVVDYENSDLKLTNEHKERYNQLKKRYESAYKRLEETFVKE